MKRQRGRNNGRKPHMPQRSQTFDSAGPDVRIRGNAYQVLEKYLAMARDASAAGDRIAAENFYQHAEHYYRVISANGEHNRQQQQHQQHQQHPQHPQQMQHGQPQGYGQQVHPHGQGPHGNDPRGGQSYGGGQPYDAPHQNGGGYGGGSQPVAHQHPQQSPGQGPDPESDPNGPDRRRD